MTSTVRRAAIGLGLAPAVLFIAHGFFPLSEDLSFELLLGACVASLGAIIAWWKGLVRHPWMLLTIVAPAALIVLRNPIRRAVVRRVAARAAPLVRELERFQQTHNRPADTLEEATTHVPTTTVPGEAFAYRREGARWILQVTLPAHSGAVLEYPAPNCLQRYRYCVGGWGYAEE